MIKNHKIEFFPDMVEGGADGPCALVLQFFKPNSRRFKKMTNLDKIRCIKLIAEFERSLKTFKDGISSSIE